MGFTSIGEVGRCSNVISCPLVDDEVMSNYFQTSTIIEMLNSINRNSIESQNNELCLFTFNI